MQGNAENKFNHKSFWLSLLFHLLALIFILLTLTTEKATQEASNKRLLPNHFVPAYTYTGSIKPSMSHPVSRNQPTIEAVTEKKIPATQPESNTIKSTESLQKNSDLTPDSVKSDNLIPIKKISKKHTSPSAKLNASSLLSASFDAIKADQLREVSESKDSEPIYLIGDDNSPADPLIKLMGRSLSAHFKYPRAAGELGIKGRVVIEFTLHPEGYYSNIKMLKSSNNQDLDAAALYAVNSAPTVAGADRFISKPRHFVVGFVFY